MGACNDLHAPAQQPMAATLRRDLSFCRAGNELVFLDIEKDRYFRLVGATAIEFDRFISASEPRTRDFPGLVKADIVVPAERPSPILSERLPIASRTSPALHRGPTRIGEIAIALISEARIRRALHRGRLHTIISGLKEPPDQKRVRAAPDDGKARRVIRAFELAKLLRSPANLCLSRSIALTQRLRTVGCHANLVMGVRASPFAAHSWTQFNDIVLNDTCEEVARFEPILVV